MLQALLLYIGDTQREGTFVTRRIRTAIFLRIMAGLFFFIAFVAAVAAATIYLADELGAGPAALIIAGTAFLLGVIMLCFMALSRRTVPYAASPIAPVAAAPLAAQALAGSALQARPFTTLVVAIALGYIATRTTMRKK